MKRVFLVIYLVCFLFSMTACVVMNKETDNALNSKPAETVPNLDPSENETVPTDPSESDPDENTTSQPEITEPTTEPAPTEPESTEPPTTEPPTTEPPVTEPPHVHDYALTTTVSANCTSGGYGVYTCSGCGKSYQDNKTEILGHSYGNWAETSRDGIAVTEQRSCSRCGDVTTRQKMEYPSGDYKEGIINESYMSQNELDECAGIIYELTKPWMDADLSEFERAEKAFLYLQDNVTYVFDKSIRTSNLVGPLIHGKADCWGYSTTFQYLCQAMGLECYFVTPVNMNQGKHRWNIVKIDGKYYHVDATSGYFLMSDEEVGVNEETMKNYPACPESSPYGNYWYGW